jgi:hypothetical protein
MYIIRYLCIGAEGGNIDICALLGMTLRAFVEQQSYAATGSVYIYIYILLLLLLLLLSLYGCSPVPVTAPSKASVCGRSLAGNVGSKPSEEHGCLSVVDVVCCQVEVSATGRSLVQKGPTECDVSEYDRKVSIMSRPWRTGGLMWH